jgi:hypothetical protein
MSENRKQTDTGHETEWADPPHPPRDDCDDFPQGPQIPSLTAPTCDPPNCNCKSVPSSDVNCPQIEDLIAAQTAKITAAEKAKTFKTALEALLGKAKAATQDYTLDKYEKACKQWAEQDEQIAELIRKLECSVTCWECVIECHICTLLNDLHIAEQWLYGDGSFCSDVHNLYDLKYWHSRDKEAKERRFNRVQGVLAAWEKPAQTIDKALTDDAKLISDISKLLGPEPAKAIYDLFFRLIPMHLAIAPVSGLDWKTKDAPWRTNILKKYTDFCSCDEGNSDKCCGVDFGELSLRQRLTGTQPYLIDPKDYFNLICCIVEQRYAPAKEALADAEVQLTTVTDQIARYEGLLKNGWVKDFETAARAAIPSAINCDDYKPKEPDSDCK